MKIVFFCSGNGGNFKFIHLLSNYLQDFHVTALFTDRPCGAEKYAQRVGINFHRHSFKRTIDEDAFLIAEINKIKPNFVVTNIHKIISARVLEQTDCKFINLHYSLLPAFTGTIGMQPVEDALKQGCKFLGSTCHTVTEDVDLGPILAQSIFQYEKATFNYDLIFKSGCLALLSGIMNLSSEKIFEMSNYSGISVNPGIEVSSKIIKDVFNELDILNAKNR